MVVANDSDGKRAKMLVHQTKRLLSPCLVVTHHDAQFFPYIYITPKKEPAREGIPKVLQFDRILCDVCNSLLIVMPNSYHAFVRSHVLEMEHFESVNQFGPVGTKIVGIP